MYNLKQRLIWAILIWNIFIILIIENSSNLKYIWQVLHELKELLKKNSKYTEDKGWVYIHQSMLDNLKRKKI